MKGLINIKTNDNKCFLLYHIRYLNPLEIHPERITKADKNIVNDLHYEDIKIALMYFVMKITWFILFIYQMKKLKIAWFYY